MPSKYGWVFVNPYMTLVAAYERLIHGRGTEVKDEPVLTPIGAARRSDPPPWHTRPSRSNDQSSAVEQHQRGSIERREAPARAPRQSKRRRRR